MRDGLGASSMPLISLFSPDEEPSRPSPATVADVIAAYDDAESDGQNQESIANRRKVWAAFCAIHGNLPHSRLRKADVLAFIKANPSWKSPWTRKRAVATICRPFSWAQCVDLIERNPLAGLSLPDGASGRAMTDAEFRLILRSTDVSFRRVLLFLRMTGCRPGELAAMLWTHFDSDKRWVTLPPDQHKTGRKTLRPRRITLHPVLMRLLAKLPKDKPNIFLNSRGKPWTRRTLDQRLKRLRKELGISKTAKLYGVRHQFGTCCVRKGIAIKAVAQLMGHRDSRTTEKHYVHLDDDAEYLQEAIIAAFEKPK